jgi:LuxR family maltose regulon positive regulatory protein
MGEDATHAFELESDHSPWRAVCRLYQGIASHLTGDPTQARELLDDGVHRSAQMPSVESLCHAQLAIIALGEKDWELADERSRRATALIEHHDLSETPSAALVFAVAALVRAQLGRADGAKELVRQAIRLLRTSDHYAAWYAEETRIMLARAAARLTDVRRARTLLAEASRAARRVPDAPFLNAWLDEALGELDSGAATALEGSSLLTLAELRILRFLPTHLSFREIGDRLHVSTNTVKSQAHAVYRKLDACSRSEAVARASRVGLIWSGSSTDM